MQKLWILPVLLLVFTPRCLRAQKAGSRYFSSRQISTATAIQYGIASFYDNKFEGRQTSNGEIFTQKKLTAASNTLPLNSWARVTNLSNKRSVIVRITDRMHPKNKRLIDLSRTAASKLAFIGKGLTRVRVEYLGTNKPSISESQ